MDSSDPPRSTAPTKVLRKTTLVWVGLLLTSLATGAVAGLMSSHLGLGLISGVLALLGFISIYAALARLLGWPRLRWDDMTAIWYLLP